MLISFAVFARDQAAGASQHQRNELVAAASGSTVRPTPAKPTPAKQPRRFIDSAASALTSPFDSVVATNDAWVRRGVPTLLALLVYGIGLRFLARSMAFDKLAP